LSLERQVLADADYIRLRW